MRKTYNSINRNNNVYHYLRNNMPHSTVPPDFFVNQLWVQDEEPNGVKIIELFSSDSSREPSIKNGNCNENYLNSEVLEEISNSNYKTNEQARQKRRLKNEQSFNPANECFYGESNPYYAYDNEGPGHQMNCFTIINNQQFTDSSSSANDYDGVEIMEVDNTDENNYWDHVYNDDVVTYHPKNQTEKRTVWIYSYKNKRMLAENDYELVNIPSKDNYSSTSTSNSISDEETPTSTRMRSPIPTYIPRLDLSQVQTLSTVTEITEHKSNRSSQEKIHVQPKNNWLAERNEKIRMDRDNLNWMALSPRERRRRSIKLTEVTNTISHEIDVTCPEGDSQIEIMSQLSNRSQSKSIQTKVDVHDKEELDEAIPDVLPIKLSLYDEDKGNENELTELDIGKVPRIKLDNKIDKSAISDPMEKLESNNWISDEKEEDIHYDKIHEVTEDDVERYSESSKREDVSRRLWTRNLQLMKPPQWMEYLPITCSPSSLNLSLSLPSLKKGSWFKRFTRCIKCCK